MRKKSNNVEKVLVTAGPKAPPDKKVLETPPGDRDVQVVIMSQVRQIATRTIRTYLQALIAFLPVIGFNLPEKFGDAIDVPMRIGATDATDLIITAASYAFYPTVVTFLWNLIEFMGEWDTPEWRA